MIDAVSLGDKLFGSYLELARKLHPEAPVAPLFADEALFANTETLRQMVGEEKFFDELLQRLRRRGFRLRETAPGFLETTRVLPLLHARSPIPAGVVLAGPGLEDAFMERALERKIGGVTLFVSAPEDLIVMKVLPPRDKDRADVLVILTAHPSIWHELGKRSRSWKPRSTKAVWSLQSRFHRYFRVSFGVDGVAKVAA